MSQTNSSDVSTTPMLDYVPLTFGSKIAIFSREHKVYICVETMGALSASRKKPDPEWGQYVIERAPKPIEGKITSKSEERESSFGDPVTYGDLVHFRGAKGRYLSAQSMGTISCSRDTPSNSEAFSLALGEEPTDGKMDYSQLPVMNCTEISIKSVAFQKYVVATKLGLVFCNRVDVLSWERFEVQLTNRRPLKEHLTRKVKTIRPVELGFDMSEKPMVVPLQKSEDIYVLDIEGCADQIAKYARKTVDMKKIIKKLPTSSGAELGKNLDTIRNGIIQAESLEKGIQKFFAKVKKDDMHAIRLLKQFSDIREEFNTQVVQSKELKNAKQEKSKTNAVKNTRKYDDDEEDAQLQVQLQQPKAKLRQADQYTMEVEKAVALETYEQVKNMETDMNMLNTLMQDMNTLLGEQDPMLERIGKDVSNANQRIDKGTDNLRGAKKLMRPF